MQAVLILGGGFAGIAAAILFKGSDLVRFILVDRKEDFEITSAQLHAIVDPESTGNALESHTRTSSGTHSPSAKSSG